MRTWRSTICSLALSTIVPLGAIPTVAEEATVDVDLELILAVDVSDSMSGAELQLQRKGYVSTFRDPSVARAIASGEIGRIAVLYLEWAGPNHHRIVRPWTVLTTLRDTAAFADALATEPIATDASTSNRAMSFGKSLDPAPIATATATSISASLLFALESFTTDAFAVIVRRLIFLGMGPIMQVPLLSRYAILFSLRASSSTGCRSPGQRGTLAIA